MNSRMNAAPFHRIQSALPGLGGTSPPRLRADQTPTSSGPFGGAFAGASWYTRDLASWRPIRRSADAELLPEQGNLVARSRDLLRNSGIAKGGLQTIVDNVVGVGLRLS